MSTNDLTTSEKILVLAKRAGLSMPELAEKLFMTPQALNYRLRENAWSIKLLSDVARELNTETRDLV